jgi:WXG100 family type VII secretion target
MRWLNLLAGSLTKGAEPMNIEINTETLNRDVATMTEQLETLNAAVDGMYSCVEELNAMWSGAAHDVFVSEIAVDKEIFSALNSEIQNLIECMEYAKNQYDNCESEVDSLIAAIKV